MGCPGPDTIGSNVRAVESGLCTTAIATILIVILFLKKKKTIVAPDTIHVHIKTCRENMKNMHFIAPECGSKLICFNNVYIDIGTLKLRYD